jgi:hypothetical protein
MSLVKTIKRPDLVIGCLSKQLSYRIENLVHFQNVVIR